MISPEENLRSIIEEITNNEIMLPDFQRPFDWDLEKQRRLIASVLTKLPVGGILLLKANSDEYKSKSIGLNSEYQVPGTIPDKTYFLLDGQQRITCLTNVFSDVIHVASEKMVSRLASRSLLANRYYLVIERWDANVLPNSSKDIFGLRTLEFRFDVSKGEEPDFLTADIIDYIECRSFSANDYDKQPFMPCQRYSDKLDDYCFASSGKYLIPLYLLVGTDSRDSSLRTKRLNAIIERITRSIRESITTYHANLDDSEKPSFAFTVIIDEDDKAKYSVSLDKESTFEKLVEEKADLWKDYFCKYLNNCVEKLKLNKIEMPEGSRARAIDIYENMNLGGLSLSTFDLVAARVAKVSRDSLGDRIRNNLSSNTDYNISAYPASERQYIPQDYNASKKIGAFTDKRVNKTCSDLFLEVLGLYCNNKSYDPNAAKCNYSKSQEILKLTAREINDNCERVCKAIDRTFCFLQVRCGIRNIAEVNYKIMMRVIAYVFTNDKWYNNASIHDKLEAWYWAAVFSGEYDKDQNNRFENNLRYMLDSLSSGEYLWINNMKKSILNTPYFSDCPFLLMEKVSEDRVPKEHLARYFCQFFLQKTYSDLIDDDTKVNVFSKELEKHHIIPLGSVASIGESTERLREDKTNIINSPLNFVYITEKTNKEISDDSLEDYQNKITASAKAALSIQNYPSVSDLDDATKVKAWLSERHKTIMGEMINRVDSLLITK